MVTNVTKKQLYNRARLARQLIISEMRLYRHYQKEINTGIDMTAEMRQYKERVLQAIERVRCVNKNFPDSDVRNKFLNTALLHGDSDMLAVCDKLKISTSTYYNWRNSMIRVYGACFGILL